MSHSRLEAGGTEPTLATLDRVARALGLELTIAFRRVAEATPRGSLPEPDVASGRSRRVVRR
jgi:transcriptional regulator with XRE-family HTH domain